MGTRVRRALVVQGLGGVLFCTPPPLGAAEYTLPADGSRLVGAISFVTVQKGETLLDIARAHGVGYRALRLANPELDPWIPGAGARVLIPTSYILPNTPREGVVVNRAEMRLYYYPPSAEGLPKRVITFPISVGRKGWATPKGITKVVAKAENPPWIPPESVRKEAAEAGDPLPNRVPPGPDNPLGHFALRLGLPGYLIHGTNKPYGIGMRVSHGCVRLYPEHIERLYRAVDQGTPVRIVDQAYKIARVGERVFLEVHLPPRGEEGAGSARDKGGSANKEEKGSLPYAKRNYTPLIASLIRLSRNQPGLQVDLPRTLQAVQESQGIPIQVPLVDSDSGGERIRTEDKVPSTDGLAEGNQAEE